MCVQRLGAGTRKNDDVTYIYKSNLQFCSFRLHFYQKEGMQIEKWKEKKKKVKMEERKNRKKEKKDKKRNKK